MYRFIIVIILIELCGCEEIEIKMPRVQPTRHDQYFCTAVKMSNITLFIRKLSVEADASKAHHMILFGCEDLSDEKLYPNHWNCGFGRICKKRLSIKYAWAKNAPPTKLPDGVGFEIGSQQSKVRYLVLQIHYARKMKPDEYDESGIKLTVSNQVPKYRAGIHLLLASMGTIPAHSKLTHLDVNCRLGGNTPIYAFAYRTHTHKLGTVITGYRYRPSSKSKWQKIAKGNPQWPQAFYPMDKAFEIRPNDYLTSRCTYNASSNNKDTSIGGTEADEMCNLYIMYYVRSNDPYQYMECMDVESPELVMNLPAGNDEPLPPNPALEELSQGQTNPTNPPIDLNGSKYKYKSEEMSLDYSKPLGQISAVTLDKDGNFFLFHRGEKVWNTLTFSVNNIYKWVKRGPIKQPTILLINSSNGKVISKNCDNMFYMPHGLTYDDKGFLWATDVALHQVKKLEYKDGKITEKLSIGQKFHPGSDSNHFCKPTSVAVAKDGHFYVADGYCNYRIMKFSSEGKFIGQWGYPTSSANYGPKAPPGSFFVPHKILLLEDKGLVCVADRENGRVQCFKQSTEKIDSIIAHEEFGGTLFSIAYSPIDGGLLYGVNGKSAFHTTQGFIMSLSSSQVISKFSPQNKENLSNPHDIAVTVDGSSIYVVEIGPNKIWKFRRDFGDDIKTLDSKPTISNMPKNESSQFLDVKSSKQLNKTISSVLPVKQLNTTLSILAILAISTLIFIVVSVVILMHKRGMCISKSRGQDKFNVSNFLNRHKGFDRLATHEDDIDAIESSESDVEEFSISKTKA